MSQELMNPKTGELLELSASDIILKAELDKNITTAKAFPRDFNYCMTSALQMATVDEETAQSCFYVLSRKNKDGTKNEIRGPSIRLAEIMANNWGNLRLRTRLVSNNGRVLTAAGRCWDLQSNNDIELEQEVSIWFGEKAGKGGYPASSDMQTMLSNAAKAKALRNAIILVIGKANVNRVMKAAMEFSIGGQQTIATKTSKVVDKLIKMGIEKEKMLSYYGVTTITEMTEDDLTSLIGVGTAIKEGYIKVEEVFEVESDSSSSLSAAEKISHLIHSKKQIVKVEDEPLKESNVPY